MTYSGKNKFSLEIFLVIIKLNVFHGAKSSKQKIDERKGQDKSLVNNASVSAIPGLYDLKLCSIFPGGTVDRGYSCLELQLTQCTPQQTVPSISSADGVNVCLLFLPLLSSFITSFLPSLLAAEDGDEVVSHHLVEHTKISIASKGSSLPVLHIMRLL